MALAATPEPVVRLVSRRVVRVQPKEGLMYRYLISAFLLTLLVGCGGMYVAFEIALRPKGLP